MSMPPNWAMPMACSLYLVTAVPPTLGVTLSVSTRSPIRSISARMDGKLEPGDTPPTVCAGDAASLPEQTHALRFQRRFGA